MDIRTQQLYDYLGKEVQVLIDRPMGCRHGDIVYPVNYGYLPGTLVPDGEPQDVYVLGITEPLHTFQGQVIGAIRRRNDCEDKLIVAPKRMLLHQGEIAQAVAFQEQYFDTYVISLLQKSCGVLACREEAGQRMYLLVFENYSQCWSLPKGHMDPGETEVQTALRELREETGLNCQLREDRTATVEYTIGSGIKKQVQLFLGTVTGGDPQPQPGEIQHLLWVTEDALPDYLFPDTVRACRKLLYG